MTYLSKYGVARKIRIPMVKRGVVDHAVSADWTPAAGDVKISKDGTVANVTNLPTAIAMGNSTIWEFSLTATEMQAAQVNVTVGDSATKAVEDTAFDIETYGNASAQHAVDLSDSVRAGLTALPNVAAGANGGLPTGNASGQVAVGSFAAGAITAAAIATDAIGAAELAADAVTEIATGVWAAAARTLTANTNLNDLSAAGVRAAVGLASANLDTQLSGINSKTTNLPSDPADASDIAGAFSTVNSTLATIAGYVDTEIGTLQTTATAIKAKTDSLTFTVAGQLDANIQYVNDVQVNGDGAGTPWGP